MKCRGTWSPRQDGPIQFGQNRLKFRHCDGFEKVLMNMKAPHNLVTFAFAPLAVDGLKLGLTDKKKKRPQLSMDEFVEAMDQVSIVLLGEYLCLINDDYDTSRAHRVR
ncbi:hypothetical protein ACEQUB_01621 [Ralstonia syzygii]